MLNGIHNEIIVKEGDASVLSKTGKADLLIANINRNILLNDLHTFCSKLSNKGTLLLSGFYTEDVPIIQKAAQQEGLMLTKKESDENWCMLRFEKQ